MRFVIIIHQGLENVESFSSRPRPDQDFYFKTKTKTKTIFHVLEAPRDQDQGLETTSLDSEREALRPEAIPEFAEITQNNAITPFKVIQGHRVWYQSKAHIRFPISD